MLSLASLLPRARVYTGMLFSPFLSRARACILHTRVRVRVHAAADAASYPTRDIFRPATRKS